jgi:predicted nucleic acid-binding protein
MFKINLDSSIIISHLSGDIHKDEVIAAIEHLAILKAEILLSLISYAEIWTEIELSRNKESKEQAIRHFEDIIKASNIMLVSDNVVIAREAANAQAKYRQRGGKREVLIPDFFIGANATYYSGRLLTTNPRDFMKFFTQLEVLTPKHLIEKYRL